MDHSSETLILLSGLAADAAVFAPQQLALPNLIVPPWPQPKPGDCLDSYARSMASEIRGRFSVKNPGSGKGRVREHRPVIGGASFGGIIALHLARYVDARAVILIGSVGSPPEIPRTIRAARWVAPLIDCLPISLLKACLAPFVAPLLSKRLPHLSGVCRQFRGADSQLFRWSLKQLLRWQVMPRVDCPVRHIHGRSDRVFPLRFTSPDTVIPGGHVISLSQPNLVNAFLRETLDELSRC